MRYAARLRRIIEHSLKLEYSARINPRAGWHETLIDARTEIEDKITPTIRRGLSRRLPQLWQQARRNTAAALRLHGEHAAAAALPTTCPYRLGDLLHHDWYPKSRHGLELLSVAALPDRVRPEPELFMKPCMRLNARVAPVSARRAPVELSSFRQSSMIRPI